METNSNLGIPENLFEAPNPIKDPNKLLNN